MSLMHKKDNYIMSLMPIYIVSLMCYTIVTKLIGPIATRTVDVVVRMGLTVKVSISNVSRF